MSAQMITEGATVNRGEEAQTLSSSLLSLLAAAGDGGSLQTGRNGSLRIRIIIFVIVAAIIIATIVIERVKAAFASSDKPR